PLDVGIFSPLATAYSNEIDRLIQSSRGFSRVTKRTFWGLFRTAWNSALTFENIRSAFASPGICPLKPQKVLEKAKKETPSPISSDIERNKPTPSSVRGLRRAVKAISKEKDDIALGLDLIIRASEKLAVRNEILEHENQGLRAALVGEKNKRKKGKPIGLFDKERPGEAQFFSPAKVSAVRARAQELEDQKQREKAEAEERRQSKAVERERKAQEAQEKRETRRRIRDEKQQQKEREKEERLARQQANKQLQEEKRLQKGQAKEEIRAQKRKREDATQRSPKRQKLVVARSGRKITLPSRFQD
ncbi:pogo transposable element, putative, partial [Macrophomina phaseolina MS6]